MRRPVVLTLLLLALLPVRAAALGGINLKWDGCSLDGAGAKTFACDANTGDAFALYVSVAAPSAVPALVGVGVRVNLAFDDVAIPAWWQTATGQCREGAVAVSYAPADLVTACPDVWQGRGSLSVQQVLPGWRANVLRVVSAAAMPADSAVYLPEDGPEYTACRISIARANSTGAGACAGCALGACMYAEEVDLYQPDPAPMIAVTNVLNSALVTWNSAYTGCNADVPARNRSWGQIKSLYR